MLICAEGRLFIYSAMTACCILHCSQGKFLHFMNLNLGPYTSDASLTSREESTLVPTHSTFVKRLGGKVVAGHVPMVAAETTFPASLSAKLPETVPAILQQATSSSQKQEEKGSCLSGSPCIFIMTRKECSFSCTRVKTKTGSSNCMSHSKNRGPSRLLKSSCRLDSTLGMSLTPSRSTRGPLPCTQGNQLKLCTSRTANSGCLWASLTGPEGKYLLFFSLLTL